MLTENIYINLVRKSFKSHEKYIKHNKYNTYGYARELIGTRCLLAIVQDGMKIQVLADLSDISVVNKEDITEEILDVLNKETDWEWLEDYLTEIMG